MGSIKVLVVDDNKDSGEITSCFIEGLSDFQVIGTCTNGEALVEEVMMKRPDVVITDIKMPKKNGIEAIKECLSFSPNLKCIFITGYDEFAIEAFRISAVDYIVKPFEKRRLHQALEKAKNLLFFERGETFSSLKNNKMKKLPLRGQNSTQYISLTDIYFIEKIGKKCLVYTKEEVFETYETIGKILARLDDSFFHAHRSYIINLNKVSHIKPQNETFIVYFQGYEETAGISKLKINEVRDRILSLQD